MSYPLYWLGKQFFYPIGNTPAFSLTQDLSPEQQRADILLLGCGDPRNILFTLYSDLTIGNGGRQLDFTCCDREPAALARNILLFSLLDQDEDIHRVWDIFYHFKIDERALDLLTRQSRDLYESANSADTWKQSRFGPFLKFVDTKTLDELRAHWKNYIDYPGLPTSRKAQLLKDQINFAKSRPEASAIAASASRSAGMLWPKAMIPVADLFRKYWETGTTFDNVDDTKNATNLNPMFLYSLPGEGFNFHYGTFPHGFHLISAYAPIASDPSGQTKSTGSAEIKVSKQQFAAWCASFRSARSADNITIRFFSGEALALCHALYALQVTGNPSTSILAGAYRAAQIHLVEHVNSGGPTSFDVIDMSNLADHIGMLNLLIASDGLLKELSKSNSVIYTETLLPFGKDVTKSFLDRFCAYVPTIRLQFHDPLERP